MHVDPHFIGGLVFYGNVALCDSVSDEEVFDANVFCALGAGHFAIYFKEDGTLVVLLNQGVGHVITLGLDEIKAPQYGRHCVIDADNLRFSGASGVNLLFLREASDRSSTESHAGTCLTFAVPMHGMGGIDVPFGQAQVIYS